MRELVMPHDHRRRFYPPCARLQNMTQECHKDPARDTHEECVISTLYVCIAMVVLMLMGEENRLGSARQGNGKRQRTICLDQADELPVNSLTLL